MFIKLIKLQVDYSLKLINRQGTWVSKMGHNQDLASEIKKMF